MRIEEWLTRENNPVSKKNFLFTGRGKNILSKVIQYRSISNLRFVPYVVKAKGKDQNSKVVIRLRDNDTRELSQISVISVVVNAWVGKKTKTLFDRTSFFVRMLNYLYFVSENSLSNFFVVTHEQILEYFIYLSNNSGRAYVSGAERSITTGLFYLAERGLLANISVDDFSFVQSGTQKVLHFNCIHNKYALPPKKPSRKLHSIKPEVVMLMMDLAIQYTPRIALGVYFQIFGGLRASEVVMLEYSDFHYNIEKNNYKMAVSISNKNLRPDLRSSAIRQAKKPRNQRVIYVKGLFEEVNRINKSFSVKAKTDAVFVDTKNKPMTVENYTRYFNKLKKLLIERLEQADDISAKLYANTLSLSNWSTHIGRGIYSNIMANSSNNTYELAIARGDSSFDSSLPYLTDSENVERMVTMALDKVYEEYENGKKN